MTRRTGQDQPADQQPDRVEARDLDGGKPRRTMDQIEAELDDVRAELAQLRDIAAGRGRRRQRRSRAEEGVVDTAVSRRRLFGLLGSAAAVGAGLADLSFERVPLLDGAYSMKVEVKDRLGMLYDSREQQGFEVMNPDRSRGSVALELHADIRAASLS